MAIKFYTLKIASIWSECTFEAFFNNVSSNFGNMSVNEGEASPEQIENYENKDKIILKFFNFIVIYQKILVSLIYLLMIVFIIFNKNITNEQILLITIFLGGFLFHLLWEAKSRYVLPYVVVLIPIASIGIKERIEYIKNKYKK